jgi:hypothetical protein
MTTQGFQFRGSPQVPWITKLDPMDEIKFLLWVVQNKIPFDPNNVFSDYDMRGYWKALTSGDPRATRATSGHFPDIWKTPMHKTFSNESMYATPNAPKWVGNQLVDPQGKVVYTEK